jgi:hypothetical protein
MSDGERPAPKEDVVFIHGPAEDGEGVRVLRKRDAALEVGEIRPAREGRPLQGDLVRLTQRREHERLFDVEVVASREEIAEKTGKAHAGPARVATDAYRANWEAIFGREERELPN